MSAVIVTLGVCLNPSTKEMLGTTETFGSVFKDAFLSVLDKPFTEQPSPISVFLLLSRQLLEMPQFHELPLEIRYLIAEQTDSYSTYASFRAIDRTNLALLPFYGIENKLKPTPNEYAFINWLPGKLAETRPDGQRTAFSVC